MYMYMYRSIRITKVYISIAEMNNLMVLNISCFHLMVCYQLATSYIVTSCDVIDYMLMIIQTSGIHDMCVYCTGPHAVNVLHQVIIN